MGDCLARAGSAEFILHGKLQVHVGLNKPSDCRLSSVCFRDEFTWIAAEIARSIEENIRPASLCIFPRSDVGSCWTKEG